MENDKTVKRSIRIPLDLHQKLEWKSGLLGKTVNQVILEDLGILSGIIRFGIFALRIYIPLYYKTIKLIILAHKKREKNTELL